MKRDKVDNVNREPARASGEVFDLIHTIMHLFRSRQYRGLQGGRPEITHLEGKLLGFFARHPGATLSDLVAHSARDKGQLARLIRNLKDGGLLSVQEGEKRDRRSIRLELTRLGRSIHEGLHRQSEHLARLAIDGLTLKERGELLRLLQKVRANLENKDS